MSIITLITDFGFRDGYVGAMHGVMLNLAHSITLVDISHAVAPGAILEAAYILSTVVPYFPSDTVHLVVVDPGVGSTRRPLAIQTSHSIFVGPDNGVFSYVLQGLTDPSPAHWTAVHLTQTRYWRPHVSTTFHGRDIFAPVAAHLALGVALEALGEPITDPVVLELVRPSHLPDGSLVGEVLHVDHFGNLITNLVTELDGPLQPGGTIIVVGNERIPLVRTFSDVAERAFLAYIGSGGHLEVAARGRSAADLLRAGVGTQVYVTAATER